MEYHTDLMLLFIVTVNMLIVLVACLLTPHADKKHRKNRFWATIVLLSINFIFDVTCLVYFVCHGIGDNWKIFILLFPLTGFLLYESIAERMHMR